MTRQLGLLELITVLAIVAVLTAMALPGTYAMHCKAKRAELVTNVDGLVLAQISYHATMDDYVGCTAPTPRAVPGKKANAWADGGHDCLARLGFTVDGNVYGTYLTPKVDQASPGYGYMALRCILGAGEQERVCVFGIADVDGDRRFSCYSATAEAPDLTWCGWQGSEATIF